MLLALLQFGQPFAAAACGKPVHASESTRMTAPAAARAEDEWSLNAGLSFTSGAGAQGGFHGPSYRPAGDGTETDMTASPIEWIHLEPAALRVGDRVSAAAGGLPTYRVLAVDDHEAWVRDDDHAATRLLPLRRLHWKVAQPDPRDLSGANS
jgi:hypothetical protein